MPYYFASLTIHWHTLCAIPCNIFIFLFSGNANSKTICFSVFWKVLCRAGHDWATMHTSQSPTWVIEKTKISISCMKIWNLSCGSFLNNAANYFEVYIHIYIYLPLMNTYHWIIICTSYWLAILWMCTSIKHALLILMLWYLGPCWSLIAPPRASQFLEIQNYLAVSTCFTDKPVSPETLSSNHLLYLNLSPPAIITKDQALDK